MRKKLKNNANSSCKLKVWSGKPNMENINELKIKSKTKPLALKTFRNQILFFKEGTTKVY